MAGRQDQDQRPPLMSATADGYRRIATVVITFFFSAVSGTKLWSTRLLQDAGANDTAAGVVVSPNNSSVFATGHKNNVMTTVAIRL